MESNRPELTKRWPEALIILQSIIYGFGDPISKIAMEVTPVYAMMTVRYGMAFLVCFMLFGKRIIETVKTVPPKAWLIPGMCIGLSYLLNNVALSMTDATSVAFLRSLSVVITPAFAFLIYKTRYRWQLILIQILVLPGMYLLCVRGGLSGFGIGEIIALLAAALMAGALVFSKNYLEMVDPVSMTALQAACSTVLAVVGSIFIEGGIHLETTTPQAWLIIVYLAVLCTFLGFLMQNLALTRIDGRKVSLIQCICPVMTAVFAFIMLGEHLSAAGIVGALIIVACIIAGSFEQ
ncbi:MAG: EamA family transporter [Firmicutes bacterium]|nr:EamA family transporter [Bacillota bacterium]